MSATLYASFFISTMQNAMAERENTIARLNSQREIARAYLNWDVRAGEWERWLQSMM